MSQAFQTRSTKARAGYQQPEEGEGKWVLSATTPMPTAALELRPVAAPQHDPATCHLTGGYSVQLSLATGPPLVNVGAERGVNW